MGSPKVIRKDSVLKSIAIEEGKFVLLSQDDNVLLVCDQEPKQTIWGAGIYKVRKDFTLQLIKDNYDTSDCHTVKR